MDRFAVMDRLLRFEKTTDYMYRRSGTGEVMIGVGHVIPSVESAQRLPWYGSPTSIAVAADYDRISSAVKGLRADAYARMSKIRLDAESTVRILELDVRNRMKELCRVNDETVKYPESVNQALFDIAYAPGTSFNFVRTRRLLAACSARDWQAAALESRRAGISEERNAEIASLFIDAVS